MTEEQSVRELLGFAMKDCSAAASALVPFQLWLIGTDACPDDILVMIHDGLRKNADSSEHEVNLLRILSECWGRLSSVQRTSSLKLIEELYTRVVDWFPCFVMSDILGNQIQSEEVFETLIRFASLSEELPRALAAHGLGYANRLENPARLRALSLLQGLRTDSSETVRVEAEEALRKWS